MRRDTAITNKQYDKFFPIWKRSEDAYDGEDAIKTHDHKLVMGENIFFQGDEQPTDYYLPPTNGMKKSNKRIQLYLNYLTYASWFNGYGKTIQGYEGLIFRKEPTVELPDSMDPIVESYSSDKKSIHEIARELTLQVLLKNRVGILIDLPNVDTTGLTISEVERMGATLPFASVYYAEAILHWEEKRNAAGRKQTSYVLLSEVEKSTTKEGIKRETTVTIKYRELYLDEEGMYSQQVYIESTDKETGQVSLTKEGGPIEVTVNGKRLPFIPFLPITSKGTNWRLDYPIANDLLSLNIAHYRNSANYENALLLTGNPTPCVSGLMIKGADGKSPNELQLGSSAILEFKENGKWGFLEYTGQGVDSIKESMVIKEAQMATLGARALQSDKRGVESAEALGIRKTGEDSELASIANSISSAITKTLRLMAQWIGIENTEEISYKLNTEFTPTSLSTQEVAVLGQQVQQGLISWSTYFYNLQKGAIIPSEISEADEFDRILKDQERFSDSGDQGVDLDDNTSGEEPSLEEGED